MLILYEDAVASAWVAGEVWRAFAEERSRQRIALVPIRLDNAVLKSLELWAQKLRSRCTIGDFTRWQDPDSYQKSLEQMLCAMKVALDPASWKDAMSPTH